MKSVKKKSSKLIDPDRLPAKKIAEIWHVTPQAVGGWHHHDGCPRLASGAYDLGAVIRWREERIRSVVADRAASPGGESLDRQREANAKLLELRLRREERRLIPRDEIRLLMARLASIMRDGGETLQSSHGLGARQVLDSAIESFRREVELALGVIGDRS